MDAPTAGGLPLPPQRYIESRIPPTEWTLGKLKDWVRTCELAGANDETPFIPILATDAKVPITYFVLHCDIDA